MMSYDAKEISGKSGDPGSDIHRRIETSSERLTSTERKIAAALLADYPFAGLETIQSLAERTNVSQATITRFVQKMGCRGYQEFQQLLIAELKEGRRSPIELHQIEEPGAVRELSEFARRAASVAVAVAEQVTEVQFMHVCDLLADGRRAIHVVGGRMSDAIAAHLSRHLRQVRSEVFHLPSDPEQWPEYLLRMRQRDVLVMLDFRRYQRSLADLAELAATERKSTVIVITDKWLSPIAKSASEVLAVPTEIGTAWDSSVGALALIEAIIVNVSERDWEATRERIENWDALRIDHKRDPE